MILHFLCKNPASSSFTIQCMATTAGSLGMPQGPDQGATCALDFRARQEFVTLSASGRAETGQPRTATSSSAKHGCVVCEDFGTIIVGEGQGIVLCPAKGCVATERLKRQDNQPASAAEAPVSGTALESRR